MTPSDLITRLSEADSPSRELDKAIVLFLYPNASIQPYCADLDVPTVFHAEPLIDNKGDLPRFTESIDAALTLVPEGWGYGLASFEWNRPHARLYLCESAKNAERGFRHLWHGNARGADTLADIWGHRPSNQAISVHPVPAQWKKHGRRAGPIRNQHMLGQGIDLVVAFPGGKGTADMVRRAKKAGVEVIEVQQTQGPSHE